MSSQGVRRTCLLMARMMNKNDMISNFEEEGEEVIYFAVLYVRCYTVLKDVTFESSDFIELKKIRIRTPFSRASMCALSQIKRSSKY